MLADAVFSLTAATSLVSTCPINGEHPGASCSRAADGREKGPRWPPTAKWAGGGESRAEGNPGRQVGHGS